MSDLSTFHLQRMERLSSLFFESGDGLGAVAKRSAAVDQIVAGLFDRHYPEPARHGLAVLAVGGYGRSQLFPYSDVDLLLLFARDKDADESSGVLSALLTALWDAQLRVSQSVRTPAECARLAPDNQELHISLLDARFVAGDYELYQEFSQQVLPRFYLRENASLVRGLIEKAEERHAEHGRTIYHLEPDIKECPGGLRDYHLACWISQLANIQNQRAPLSEEFFPADFQPAVGQAKKFLFAVRCYLHYFAGRDSNRLAFDLQEAVANDGSGKAFRRAGDAAEWMRDYFRHVRVIHRLALRMIEEHGAPRDSLFTLLKRRHSRLSNPDFTVANGRVFLRSNHILDTQPELGLKIFQFVARHGLPLAAKTERILERDLPKLRAYLESAQDLWPRFAEVLRGPFAYEALKAMHETGALFALFPELQAIDCLVVRDFYHRYTVDEHSFLTIRILKRLEENGDKLTARFARLNAEVRAPEPLLFALLFHDVGKGLRDGSHATGSVAEAEKAMERLAMSEPERAIVRFLIARHLEMSNFITKRDISESETIEEFSEIVETMENLRMLALMTYADTAAVNPAALTAWRKQLLWQFYTSVHNRMTGDVEDRRIQGETLEKALNQTSGEERESLAEFLKGLPRRYLRTRSPQEILMHHRLSMRLRERGAAVHIERKDALYEVTIVAWDKPYLFASLCAALAGFGLNIERAEAFANERGIVLDTFSVTVSESRGGTELDDAELRQAAKTLRRAAEGREDVSQLLNRRGRRFGRRGRPPLEPVVTFDNQTSSRATIFHVIAEDRTGLLYDLTATFSRHGCNIDLVLIDTQGRKAIDAFYVTGPEGKIAAGSCEVLQRELREACRPKGA